MSTVRARAKVEEGQTRARNITPEFHAIYVAVVALLPAYIQLLYQHGDVSPFQTHPISMRISVVAICIYCLAALFKHVQFCSNYSQIFDYVIIVSAVLYLVSVISVFIPNWLSCLLYIIWLIFSVMVVQWILQKGGIGIGIVLFNMACALEFKLLELLASSGMQWVLLPLDLLPWNLLGLTFFIGMFTVVATMRYF